MDGEKRLIGAIVEMALTDAQTLKHSEAFDGPDAIEFLMTSRSDFYFSILGIDATEYRQGLVDYAYKKVSGELSVTVSERRALRINLEMAEKIYGKSFTTGI